MPNSGPNEAQTCGGLRPEVQGPGLIAQNTVKPWALATSGPKAGPEAPSTAERRAFEFHAPFIQLPIKFNTAP